MINEKIQNYIDDHAFCSEYLFKDWESFLDLLYAEGGRISSILWWDHCTKKQLRESVGSGGYKDPENEEFIYAETQLYKEGLEPYTLEEIKEYIDHERRTGFQYGSRYRSHELVPSFHLADQTDSGLSGQPKTCGDTVMDRIKTENYYRTLNNDSLCSCAYCRNYYKEVKAAYPELSDRLAGMGIDIEKPFETMPLEPYEGTIEYIAVQYIIMGNAADFKSEDVNGVHIGIADSHPMTDIDEEHDVIEISPIRLKWTV